MVKAAKWKFLDHFWLLLKGTAIFEATESSTKIGSMPKIKPTCQDPDTLDINWTFCPKNGTNILINLVDKWVCQGFRLAKPDDYFEPPLPSFEVFLLRS